MKSAVNTREHNYNHTWLDLKGRKLRLLNDHIIVKHELPDVISPGGIHIPQMTPVDWLEEDGLKKGRVTYAGQGKRLSSGVLKPLSVKVGDYVGFLTNVGIPTEIEGVKCIMMRERDIQIIIEGAN